MIFLEVVRYSWGSGSPFPETNHLIKPSTNATCHKMQPNFSLSTINSHKLDKILPKNILMPFPSYSENINMCQVFSSASPC